MKAHLAYIAIQSCKPSRIRLVDHVCSFIGGERQVSPLAVEARGSNVRAVQYHEMASPDTNWPTVRLLQNGKSRF